SYADPDKNALYMVPSHNSLNKRRLWRILHEQKWRVIRTENGSSGSYADRPKHRWAAKRSAQLAPAAIES
ncbi:MAG: hypothetical protein WAU40_06025, partial [Nitrospira sp.]